MSAARLGLVSGKLAPGERPEVPALRARAIEARKLSDLALEAFCAAQRLASAAELDHLDAIGEGNTPRAQLCRAAIGHEGLGAIYRAQAAMNPAAIAQEIEERQVALDAVLAQVAPF